MDLDEREPTVAIYLLSTSARLSESPKPILASIDPLGQNDLSFVPLSETITTPSFSNLSEVRVRIVGFGVSS